VESTDTAFGERIADPGLKPEVSIIVASHRPELIEGCVACFNETQSGASAVEIIIVADYPVDAFRDRFPSIQWIFIPDKSISLKRNRGIQTARGAICAFTDDDCRPRKQWVANAVAYLQANPRMAGVEGATLIEGSTREGGAYREYKRLEKPGFRTNNIFFYKHVLEEVRLFDERFTVQREDIDLAYTLIEAGYSIGYCDAVEVEHIFREQEKWDLIKNCMNRRFDPLLYAKHKALYRSCIHTPFPSGILSLLAGYVFSSMVLLFSLEAGLAFLGVTAGLITLLTVRRCGGVMKNGMVPWLREWIAFCIAPFVLLGALIYGSLKFKSVLIF
jgi:glycosyltransferase involved in cell wall biosynthesis